MEEGRVDDDAGGGSCSGGRATVDVVGVDVLGRVVRRDVEWLRLLGGETGPAHEIAQGAGGEGGDGIGLVAESAPSRRRVGDVADFHGGVAEIHSKAIVTVIRDTKDSHTTATTTDCRCRAVAGERAGQVL